MGNGPSLCGGSPNNVAPPLPLPSTPSGVVRDKVRVIFLGDQASGKTSLFRPASGSPAVHAPYPSWETRTETRTVDGAPIKLELLDTAGQERFDALPPIYYNSAQVCVLVTDLARPTTLLRSGSWLAEFDERAPGGTVVLVGNTADLLGGEELGRATAALENMAASFRTNSERTVRALVVSTKAQGNAALAGSVDALYSLIAQQAAAKLSKARAAQ